MLEKTVIFIGETSVVSSLVFGLESLIRPF